MTDEPIVHLLDDDPQTLKALRRLLRTQGLRVRAFMSAEKFLA